MRFVSVGIFFFVSLFPVLAIADTVSGGFPSNSLWLSKTHLIDGDSVEIFAPIYNSGSEKIEGNVVISVDSAAIGSVHFELGAGESKIASLAWNAKEGAHTISASIADAALSASKEGLSLSREKTESVSVTVAAAPPPPPTLQALKTAGNVLGSAVAAITPLVSSVAGSVINTTETLRTDAKSALEKSIAADAPSPANSSGEVLGAETQKNLASVAAATAHSNFSPVKILKQIALMIVSYAWIFYPLLLIIILFCFYILSKRIARPKPVRV
jgi:hypothetical protein